MSVAGIFHRPFAEQLTYFRGKLNLGTEHWDDILGAAHDRAFIVAGAMKADLLTELRGAVDKAIAEGTTLETFRRDFAAIVERHGWSYRGGFDWRTRVIYETNLRASYAAGRWAQLTDPDLARVAPYWRYKHSDSVLHPRPLHVSWDGLTLPRDHTWWQTHFPPNGWGCKCRVVAVRAKELRDGKPDTPPDDGTYTHVDRRGVAHVIPKGIDYGWAHAPGATWKPDLAKYHPEIAKELAKDIAQVSPPSRWNLATEAGRWHAESWSAAPDWLQSVVEKTADMPVRYKQGQTSHFGWSRYIQMGHPRGTHLGQSVWRHEFGHAMDFDRRQTGQLMRSQGADFTDAMKADAEAMKNGSGLGRASKAQTQRRQANAQTASNVTARMAVATPQERRAALEAFASEAKIDLDQFEAWTQDYSYIGLLRKGSMGRDDLLGRALVALRDVDAQGFLDACEGVRRNTVDFSPIYTDFGSQTEAYKKGFGKVSDLFSAATNKHVEGCGSHKASYYRSAGFGAHQAECWANLTAVAGTGDMGVELLRRWTPKMLETWKGLL